MTTTPPSRRELFSYSFLALPLAFAGLPLYVHAPDFYTRDLGLNIGMIGIVLLIVRLLDAFQDPLIGYLSDRYAPRRYAIVLGGAVMLVLGMGTLFSGPPEGINILAWFAVSMFIATTGFSIVTINLNMIGGVWHDRPGERTRISAWREAFGLTGLLVASVLPTVLQHFKPAEMAFKLLFIVFSVLMVAGFIMFTRFMSRISPGHLMTRPFSQKGRALFPTLGRELSLFYLACFFTHLAAALPGVMVLFFIEDYLNGGAYAGLFLLLYFLSGAAFMGVWVRLADRFGKEQAWLAAMLLAVVTFMGAVFLQPGDLILYGLICVLSGIALGADLALPPSILADRITGAQREAEATRHYALLAFIPKTAIALASGISFLILDSLGFMPGTTNSSDVLTGVLLLYALLPCIIKLAAAVVLWGEIINRKGKTNDFQNQNSHGGTHDPV